MIKDHILSRFCWAFRLTFCALIFVVGVALASATISNLTATYRNGTVLIRWTTSEEVDNQGFYVQRSQFSDTGFNAVSPLIASHFTASGATYTYTDTVITPGIIYYYRIEAVSSSGFSEYSSPTSVFIPLQTGTPTATGVGTATRTSTARPPTPTRPTPTGPIRTSTPTVTPTPTETPTLVPLPSITLLFPPPTAVKTATPSPTPPGGPLSIVTGGTPPSNTTTYLLGGLIVLIWVLLGVFLYLYIRRLGY